MLRIAHRGASGDGLAPENTLAAIRLAVEIGVDGIEMDVRSTSDGQLVLMHDDTVSRTTDGTGKIRELTLEQVKQLDAGLWKDKRFAGERVPTLREALAPLRGKTMPVIEAKVADISGKLAHLLDEMQMTDESLVISFNEEFLKELGVCAPHVRTGVLIGPDQIAKERTKLASILAAVHHNAAGVAAIHHSLAESSVVQDLHGVRKDVFVWTVDSEEMMEAMLPMGVDGIITNYPDLLNQVLGGKGER